MPEPQEALGVTPKSQEGKHDTLRFTLNCRVCHFKSLGSQSVLPSLPEKEFSP